jgi:hypothetical protein
MKTRNVVVVSIAPLAAGWTQFSAEWMVSISTWQYSTVLCG